MVCVRGYFQKFEMTRVEYPVVNAKVYVKDKYVGIIDFVVDTGASATLISWRDAIRLNLKPKKKSTGYILGVGGLERVGVLGPVVIELVDAKGSGSVQVKLGEVHVAMRDALKSGRGRGAGHVARVPSLLGWDILKNFILKINYKSELVEICTSE